MSIASHDSFVTPRMRASLSVLLQLLQRHQLSMTTEILLVEWNPCYANGKAQEGACDERGTHMCDVTRLYMRHDSIYACDMTYLHVCYTNGKVQEGACDGRGTHICDVTHLCVYIYIYYICIYLYIYMYIHVYIVRHAYIHTYTYMYTYICIHPCVYMCVYMYSCMCFHT